MGKNIAEVAVLLINSVANVVTRQMAVNTTIGSEPQTPSNASARSCDSPVCSIAFPKHILPANTISAFQLMFRSAWLMLQHLVSNMAKAAMKQALSNGRMPKAARSIIASMMRVETIVLTL